MDNIEKIIDTSGTLLTKNAINKGFSKFQLYSFIKKNNFERVAYGIYVSPDTLKDENYILSLRCPQGVFSHDEALYYHGLVDREPTQKTITVYTGYGTSALIKDGIKVFTVKKELLSVGVITGNTSFGHTIPIYDLERTICDLVRSRTWFEIQDFQTALRTYVGRKDKNLNKLMDYAKLFHVDNIIREYMEIML